MVDTYSSKKLPAHASCTCSQCGASFLRVPSRIVSAQVFCSPSCRVQWDHAQALALFWSRIDRTATCWLWRGPVSQRGYGTTRLTSQGKRLLHVHRLMWTLSVGTIPQGLHVLHHCDNRICVNPAHLFLGTNQDNIADKRRKGRGARGTAIGHGKLTEQQVYAIRALQGTMTQGTIGAMFGVSHALVSDIHRRKAWGWLPEVDDQGQLRLPL